jgi:hypothetical protein
LFSKINKDWSLLPKELHYFYEKSETKREKRKSNARPNLVNRKKKKETQKVDLAKLVEVRKLYFNVFDEKKFSLNLYLKIANRKR